MSIALKISEKNLIEGDTPIVILGPNGSGKTRYGLRLAQLNNAEMIAALRNIELGENIPMQPFVQAAQELSNQKRKRHSRPWSISNEINNLFAKLMVEDSDAAVEFRDNYTSNPANSDLKPKVTKLMRLSTAWHSLFPGRHIRFAGYMPKVTSEYAEGTQSYAAQQMSDGERVALYLAGRVLDSEASVILVDEPEGHFLSRLAVQFWDELERLRSDCRFVYITHDLNFALSRNTSQFLVVRPKHDPELIDLTSQDIPVEISTQILSAASFSIFADKFVFCEGAESSLDQKFLRAWYKDQRTAVIPVGSCRDVIRCTTSFRNNRLLANVTAIGIIDRDYWPDNFIEALPDGLNTLPVHEIESLFCYRTVFEAVAAHLGKQKPEADALYNEFLAEAKRKFDGAFLTKQISERFRARCEAQVRDRLNDLEIDADLVKVKANHCGALSQPIMDINLAGKIFDEESKRVEQALAGTEKEFLVVLPGKAYWGILTEKLGLEKSTYTDLIIDALRADDEADLSALGKSIRQKLEKIIPTVDQ